MDQNLPDYRLFIDEADNLHLSAVLRTGQWIDLPYLFDAFTPYQLRYSRGFIGPDIYNAVSAGNYTFALLIPFFLFPSVSTHPITLPTTVSDQLK